jgi:hypothetical protein
MWPLDRKFSLHRLPEIEYQVKTIGHLDGFRCATPGSLGVDAVTVSAHHDHFPALQIHQDRAKRLTLAPCPIVDPHDADYVGQGTTLCRADDLTEQGVPTDRHTQSTHQALAGTPTQGAAHQHPDLTQAEGLLCVRP